MARTVVEVAVNGTNGSSDVTFGALTAGATGTAGYVVSGQSRAERFGLVVTNTGSATGTLWIKASDSYILKDQGDLAIVIGGSVNKVIGPLETQRFAQSGVTGAINIDSGITGVIGAFQI